MAQSQSLQVDAGVELRLNEQVQRWCRLTATDRQKGSRVIGLNRAPTSVGVFHRQLWREERASSAPTCSYWWPRNLLEIIMKCVLCTEPFSWEDYLRETSSIAASPTCFKQVSLWLMYSVPRLVIEMHHSTINIIVTERVNEWVYVLFCMNGRNTNEKDW